AACATGTALRPGQASADVATWAGAASAQAARIASEGPASVEQQTAPGGASMAIASLAELYSGGIDFSPQIRVAHARVSVADAELSNATFRFFPSLRGTVTRSHTSQNILDSDNKVFQ